MSMPLQQQVAEERTVITNDGQADRAARKVLALRVERDRRIAHYERQIAYEKEAYEKAASFYLVPLREYLENLPVARDTKSMRKHLLPSAELVLRKPSVQYKPDDETFATWLKASGYQAFIKTVEKPMWGEFKKQTDISANGLIDTETGEFVQGVAVTMGPATFDVKEVHHVGE